MRNYFSFVSKFLSSNMTKYEFEKWVDKDEELTERFNLIEHFAHSNKDKELLFKYFGCMPYNNTCPENIINSCDTLRDYNFSELFEEVKLSDIQEEVESSTGKYFDVYGRGEHGSYTGSNKYNVVGYYLILTPDGSLCVNTPSYSAGNIINPHDKIYVLNDGTRLFKLKPFKIDRTKYNFHCADETRLDEIINCLRDLISSNYDIYYKKHPIHEVINSMTIKFVPVSFINDEEYLSVDGLIGFRYNEIC